MGSGGYSYYKPVLEPSTRVPELVSVTTQVAEETAHSPEVDRRDKTPLQVELPVVAWSVSPAGDGRWNIITPGGVQIYRLSKSGAEIIMQEQGLPLPAWWNPIPTGIVESTDEETDVGILGDIYDVVDTSLGGLLPGGVPPQLPVGWGGPTAPIFNPPTTVNLPVPQSTGGMVPPPPGGYAVASCDNDPYKGMIYTVKRGWHKRPRRRRRDLATKGDLKDLASLKGILGTGKAFDTWIATH